MSITWRHNGCVVGVALTSITNMTYHSLLAVLAKKIESFLFFVS